ncbi:MAG: ATP-binding protein [Alphaproteobacteria bacterium]|nr:ATP-binding protein [Alphaproteobacteria bacterium]
MTAAFFSLPAFCAALTVTVLALYWKIRKQRALLTRQAEELRAARRQEALDTMAGGIAHDFNNILGSILGFGVLLEEDLIAAPEQRDMARQITTAARRGQNIVAQLMRYSRRGAADSAQLTMPVSLDAIIRENIDLLTPCIRRSTRLSYTRGADDDIIEADATQLGQALVNLCLNADHAIGLRAGHIRISLDRLCVTVPCGEDNALVISGGEEAGDTVTLINGRLGSRDYLRIRVEDDGEGMTRDVAAKIFDPFFTTRDVGAGSGLGLPALQGILQGLGGAIIVTTTRFKGSVFELMIPAGQKNAA